uniref:ZAD domain-containing protein n=1 Tax=Anopheles christyi TaxID=43041 RepID=A0A182K8J2_9DIPT
MSSSASSSTAGSNAAGATAAANPPGQAGDVGNHGSDGSGPAATSGPEGNIVEKQPSGAGGGHPGTEPHTSSPAHPRHGGGPGGTTTTTSTTGTVLRRKTNVCLICGIYTNLSLNIFEPRSGPNIVDVIYEKYKFRAERGDNADKHICFSCNNWLINWYSLQNTSSGSSRTYEPAPSTSRSSSAAADSSNNSRNGGRRQHAHKKRTKTLPRIPSSTATTSTSDKENRPQKRASNQPEQHGQISSTTSEPAENWTRPTPHPYSKKIVPSVRRSLVLKENNGQRVAAPSNGWNQRSRMVKQQVSDDAVTSSTEESFDPRRILVKPFESRLIQMLQGQGTSVTKENASLNDTGPWTPPRAIDSVNGNSVKVFHRRTSDTNGNVTREVQNNLDEEDGDDDGSKEIVISFDSTLSEVIDVVPSLKAIQCWYGNEDASMEQKARNGDAVQSLRQRLSSGALTVSIIG